MADSKEDQSGVLTAGKLYDVSTSLPERSWFGLADTGGRFATTACLYYYFALTHPFSFFKHVWAWNRTWHGPLTALVASSTYLAFPATVMVWSAWKRIKPYLFKVEADWMMAGPGRVFFLSPEGRLSTLLWDSYLDLSQMVGVFLMCSKSEIDLAVEHSLYDRLTDKDFWRGVMGTSKIRVPYEFGRWESNKLALTGPQSITGKDIVAKIVDSYLGIGDRFLEYGKDFESKESLEKLAIEEAKWQGKTTLFLEWVRPLPKLGVHSVDIVTIDTPKGPKVVSCLYWGECTGVSSHSAQGGYIVDVETETLTSPARFYSPFFSKQQGKLVGLKLPGLKKAVAMALKGHAEALKKNKWLKMIGWDAMFTKREGEVVFFEGNFAASRIHRRITFAPSNAYNFLKMYGYI